MHEETPCGSGIQDGRHVAKATNSTVRKHLNYRNTIPLMPLNLLGSRGKR